MLLEGAKTSNLNSRNKAFAVLVSWSNPITNWAKHFGAIMDVRKTYTSYSFSTLIFISIIVFGCFTFLLLDPLS